MSTQGKQPRRKSRRNTKPNPEKQPRKETQGETLKKTRTKLRNPEAMIATKEIAPYGDIMIEIPSAVGTAKLKVASQVLCAASPVFRAMLGPSSSFIEACELRKITPSAEPYRLSLDDDPEALGVILLALHCQNTLVPRSVTFKNLVDLAIVCDKYDCAAGVSLWADLWTKPWIEFATQEGYEHWLFVAWTFEIPDVFEKLSRHITLQGHFSTQDPTLFVTKEGFCLDEMLVPEFIIAIREKRATIINTLSELTYSYKERYLTSWGEPLCRERDEACDALVLGSIIKSFQSLGIATNFDKFILKSIEEIRDEIRKLRIKHLSEQHGPYLYFRRDTCGFLPEFNNKLNEATEGVQGLKLCNFKSARNSTDATVARWGLFEYE